MATPKKAPAWLTSKRGTRRRYADATHGTASTYTYWQCRCAACTEAIAEQNRERVQGRTHAPHRKGVWCTNRLGIRRHVKDLPHNASTYTNWGCRCADCRGDWNVYCDIRRAERLTKLAPDDERHGRYTTYTNYDCRCAACREANRLHSIDYEARRRKARAS